MADYGQYYDESWDSLAQAWPAMEYQDSEDEDPRAWASAPTSMPHGQAHQGMLHPKHAPHFDGRSSWFKYEEVVYDWLDITTLDAEKIGPSLKNKLIGDAEILKNMLDGERLREPADGGRVAAKYLMDTLRPNFIKGTTNVFMYRFLKFFSERRGNRDFLQWQNMLQVTVKRLRESWMDLLAEVTITSTEWLDFAMTENVRRTEVNLQVAWITAAAQQLQQNLPPGTPTQLELLDENNEDHFDQWCEQRKRKHERAFPFSENLLAMFHLVLAELSADQ